MSSSWARGTTRRRRRRWLRGLVCSFAASLRAALILIADCLHLGGGITDANAQEWLDAGAEKVRSSPHPSQKPTDTLYNR